MFPDYRQKGLGCHSAPKPCVKENASIGQVHGVLSMSFHALLLVLQSSFYRKLMLGKIGRLPLLTTCCDLLTSGTLSLKDALPIS